MKTSFYLIVFEIERLTVTKPTTLTEKIPKSKGNPLNESYIMSKTISQKRFWGIAAATIEDLAIEIRSSREPDGVGRRACLSEASCAAAEKSE
jgi:hypothetical protein